MAAKCTIGPDTCILGIRLPRTQRERVDAAAKAERTTPSAIVRHALTLREAVLSVTNGAGVPAK